MSEQTNAQAKLIEALKKPETYPHPVTDLQEIQTHISTVLLTGEYAYKVKKPLDLGFLNFLSLADRKHYCEEELRLNRRLAPQLYLDVVAFTGSPEQPAFDGKGEPFEYAVKMRQFDQDQLLNDVLARGLLSAKMIDEIARRMARFHEQAAVAGQDTPFGTPEAVLGPMTQNFEQVRPLLTKAGQLDQLARIEQWTLARHAELQPLLAKRKQNGHIRECHGDMHLGNMALVDNEVAIFDGIEFNDYFRWIDVMSELAFLVMDLDDRGAHALANRVLNAYLEESGDYEGLRLLRFYQVYRAMVRAKVSSIRLSQGGLSDEERAQILEAYQGYANLAERYTTLSHPAVMITHGFSGCGKTTVAQQVVDAIGAIRVRSDIERKRLFGFKADDKTKSELSAGIYTAEATEQTYARLLEASQDVIAAGFPVIADATFLRSEQRGRFSDLAATAQLPFLILDVRADEGLLRQRVEQRPAAGADASEANLEVLEQQLKGAEALASAENAIAIESTAEAPIDDIKAQIGLS